MMSTILGGRGFIGRHLAAALSAQGNQCWQPGRGDAEIFERPLGTVYYCIGLTADFRNRPFDTVDAHVCVLRQVLERAHFDQLIYLSSTRVYAGNTLTDESQLLSVAPYRPDDLYNITKLMGESLTLASGGACRVARLSNVLGFDMGPTNFVGALFAEARELGAVRFRTSLASAKDYVWVDDAVSALIAIAEKGRQPIYNIAGGANVSHEAIANLLAANGIPFTVMDNAPTITFPPISIDRLVSDTGFHPNPIAAKLSASLEMALGIE